MCSGYAGPRWARHIERSSENPQQVVAESPADKARIPLMPEPGRPEGTLTIANLDTECVAGLRVEHGHPQAAVVPAP